MTGPPDKKCVAVLGAGSWGTALSIVLAGGPPSFGGHEVRLWTRRPEAARAMNRTRHNPDYLSEFALPAGVAVTADIGEAAAGADIVILAVPSDGVRPTCEQLAPHLRPGQGIVNAAKGLEHQSGRRLSEVIAEVLGGAAGPIAVLSGPNLAPEVAAGIATVSVVASADREFAREIQVNFSTPRFRLYTNPDVLGVELGGALKNIVAIAAGACDGLGFGDNTKAALLTRGLAEISRLGVALGARAETFHGLAGVGDLVATCAGRKSRNHRVGYELARGRRLPDILADMSQVAEGVETTRAARRLAGEHRVEMPITAAVHAALFEGMAPREAVTALMTRSWRDELEG